MVKVWKAAIEDIIMRGEFSAWRGLIRAIRSDKKGLIGSRVRSVVAALDKSDPKARAFAALLPELLRNPKPIGANHASKTPGS